MANAAALEFDTLAATRELVAAGLERQQAEAIAVTVRASRAGLATKTDLDNLEVRLSARIDANAADLNARIDANAADLNARIDASAADLNARIDASAADLSARIDANTASLDAKISGLETRMLRVAIAIVLAQTALTAALTAGLTFGLLKMFGGAP